MKPAGGLKIKSSPRLRTNIETIVSRLTTIDSRRAFGPAAIAERLSSAIAAVLFTKPPNTAV